MWIFLLFALASAKSLEEVYQLRHTRHNPIDRKFQYVMYVSETSYFKGAVAVVRMLHELQSQYPILLIHSVPIPNNIDIECETKFTSDFPKKNNGYYRNVMLKLSLFNLVEIERIVYVECDCLPIKNLDHLFHIPLINGFAAPIQHWGNGFTDILMVLEPSTTKYSEIMQLDHPGVFDMDILNKYFQYYTKLPSSYGFLNGLLGDSYPMSLHGLDVILNKSEDIFQVGYVMHFTSVGKPWNYKKSQVLKRTSDRDATVWQGELFGLWWLLYSGSNDLCNNSVFHLSNPRCPHLQLEG